MNQEKAKYEHTTTTLEQGGKWLTAERIIRNLPFLLMLTLLALVYIANSHYHIKLEREMEQTRKEIKELRWRYMTSKSDLMYRSKQSEVAKAAEPLGLKPLTEPPIKIVVKQ